MQIVGTAERRQPADLPRTATGRWDADLEVLMGEGNRIWRILFIVALAVSMAVVGGVIGLLLGAAVGGIHLDLYHRSGREAAGTEVILIPLYAIPIGILGAAAGLIGGLLLGRRRHKRSEVELAPSRDDPGAAAERARRGGLPE